eukprot:Em0674g5a
MWSITSLWILSERAWLSPSPQGSQMQDTGGDGMRYSPPQMGSNMFSLQPPIPHQEVHGYGPTTPELSHDGHALGSSTCPTQNPCRWSPQPHPPLQSGQNSSAPYMAGAMCSSQNEPLQQQQPGYFGSFPHMPPSLPPCPPPRPALHLHTSAKASNSRLLVYNSLF